jgi:hypothetical protein
MNSFRKLNRSLSTILVVLLAMFSIQGPAYGAIVGTDVAISQQQSDVNRTQLLAMFERSDLRDQLIAQGVNPDNARERIAALSDAEVQAMVGKLDQLPNGGDVVGAVVFVFLVLLVTDIIGWTDVYPFIR